MPRTAKDLKRLSELGHFLKGSSAALGVCKVQASCETIQHLGAQSDPRTGQPVDSESALKRIVKTFERTKKEYAVAERYFKHRYDL